MLRHRLVPLAASAALAVFVAACGGSATAAPSAAAPSVAPSVAAAPASAATTAPAESTAPFASGAIPSFAIPSFSTDATLEAMLPATFGGVTLQKMSFKGADFLDQDPTSEFNKALTALGLTASSVSMASAFDPTGQAPVQFIAVRFAGADSAKLLDVFKTAAETSGDFIGAVNLAGKDLLKAKNSSGAFSYLYVRGDVVLGVTAPDDATAATGLAVLP